MSVRTTLVLRTMFILGRVATGKVVACCSNKSRQYAKRFARIPEWEYPCPKYSFPSYFCEEWPELFTIWPY